MVMLVFKDKKAACKHAAFNQKLTETILTKINILGSGLPLTGQHLH